MQTSQNTQDFTKNLSPSAQDSINSAIRGAKSGVIIYLVVNVLFLFLIIWLLYRGISDNAECLSKVPLIVISVIWLISILIQLAGSSFILYVLNK